MYLNTKKLFFNTIFIVNNILLTSKDNYSIPIPGVSCSGSITVKSFNTPYNLSTDKVLQQNPIITNEMKTSKNINIGKTIVPSTLMEGSLDHTNTYFVNTEKKIPQFLKRPQISKLYIIIPPRIHLTKHRWKLTPK